MYGERNKGSYVMHTWAAGIAKTVLQHEAQVLEDCGNPSEIDEALGPEMTAKVRALKAGEQIKYKGMAWGRFKATILIHKIW